MEKGIVFRKDGKFYVSQNWSSKKLSDFERDVEELAQNKNKLIFREPKAKEYEIISSAKDCPLDENLVGKTVTFTLSNDLATVVEEDALSSLLESIRKGRLE